MAYKRQKGFTVVELMIAIAVFAIAVVLVMAGVIYIGRKYQQSSTRVALEDASRNIHQQVGQAVQFSQRDTSDAIAQDASTGNLTARCIGKDMFIFDKRAIDIVDTNPDPDKFSNLEEGLWLKRDPTGGCAQTDVNKTDAVNLLPPNAKTIVLDYTTNRLTTLFVRAPDDTYLKFGSTPDLTTCNYTLAGREFCADVKLTSYTVGRID